MFSWISQFHNFRLQTKILLSFASVILLTVLLVVTVIYQVSLNTIKNNSTEYSLYLNEQLGINLDKRTRDLEESAFNLFVASGLNMSGERGTTEFEMDSLLQSRYVSNYMYDLMLSEEHIAAVLFDDIKGRRFEIVRRTNFEAEGKLPDHYSPKAVREARGRAIWYPSREGDLVFMGKALYNVHGSSYAGTVIVGIDSDYIRSIYTKVNELTSGNVLLLNENNEPLVKETPQDALFEYFLEKRLYENASSEQNVFQYNNQDYIYSVLRMPRDKWKIAHIVPVNVLTRGGVVIQFWTISVLIVALLLAFLSSIFVSKRVTENVRLLLQSMSRMSIDFTPQMVVPQSRDEIGILTERFNTMAKKIDELVNKVYKEQMLKQDAEYRTLQSELRTLQAQINPHFLYNTLESIQSLAKLKGENEIGDMIYLLGSLLRDSIGRKGDLVKLRDEVDFIARYLEIQRFMYEDRVSIEYKLEDELMDCIVPRFLLQPLVENAIVHGIEQKPGKGVIRVASELEGDTLVLTVADNGVGISEEDIARLLNPEREAAAKPNHTSVGLRNVHRRVQFLYGEQYGVEIRGRLGEGTTIMIRLPAVKEGEALEEDRSSH